MIEQNIESIQNRINNILGIYHSVGELAWDHATRLVEIDEMLLEIEEELKGEEV